MQGSISRRKPHHPTFSVQHDIPYESRLLTDGNATSSALTFITTLSAIVKVVVLRRKYRRSFIQKIKYFQYFTLSSLDVTYDICSLTLHMYLIDIDVHFCTS